MYSIGKILFEKTNDSIAELQEKVMKNESDLYLIISSHNPPGGDDEQVNIKKEKENVAMATEEKSERSSKDRGNRDKRCIICCSSYNLRSITDDYPYFGSQRPENYYNMLDRCFGKKFAVTKNDKTDAICTLCIGRLRQCLEFKKEVELAHMRFTKYIREGDSALERTTTNTPTVLNITAQTSLQVHTNHGATSNRMDKSTKRSKRDEIENDCIDESKKLSYQIRGNGQHGLRLHVDIPKVANHLCKICDKKFTLRTSLVQHIKSIHNKYSLYKCGVCDKRFKASFMRRQHMVDEHGHTFPAYTCERCHKLCSTKSRLRIHLNTHYKETFFCDTCSKKFITKQQLQRHLVVH